MLPSCASSEAPLKEIDVPPATLAPLTGVAIVTVGAALATAFTVTCRRATAVSDSGPTRTSGPSPRRGQAGRCAGEWRWPMRRFQSL